ncbi:hypothetical protein MRB53_033543 [Persea americana]|uniref:Uncharacterized protein n=1 Tax=Persea americana TaxID=3435 RepID=A0ACC2KVK4_PERAE|nr:hypothetical protein MRB53_033543 [Persea americana]
MDALADSQPGVGGKLPETSPSVIGGGAREMMTWQGVVGGHNDDGSKPPPRMTEPPFVPRERLLKRQQYFQSIQKHTYLKGRYDKITSVAIPLALAATSGFMIVRGVYNMSHGIGKKE